MSLLREGTETGRYHYSLILLTTEDTESHRVLNNSIIEHIGQITVLPIKEKLREILCPL